MQATDILSAEHRVILQVTAALDAAADRLDAGQPVRPGFMRDAVRFMRDYSDGYHHAKEEGVLFVALTEAGMPSHAGPVGVMLMEHDRARELTAGLAEATTRWAGGDAAMAGTVAECARDYAALLGQHIMKEDHILFPMAGQLLPEDGQDALLPAFAMVEDAQRGRGSKVSFEELARTLATEMDVDPDALPEPEFAFACHGQ
ncbi:MAG: hemerythrin domain-containing protein [Burkholderiales bacterium]